MPDEKTFDFVVVGAGPAGSTFATLAARAGKEVCLIERRAFPRDRVGESITVDCAKRLVELGLPSPLQQSPPPWRIGSMKVHYENGGTYQAMFPEALQHYLIRRAGFDEAILEAAKSAGAQSIEGTAQELLLEGGVAVGVGLRGGEKIFARRLVVAASGRETGFLRGAVEFSPDERLKIFGGRAFCERAYDIPQNQVELYVTGKDIAIVTPLEDGQTFALFVLLQEPVSLGKEKASSGQSSQERAFRGLLSRFPSLSSKLSARPFEPNIEFHAQMAARATKLNCAGLALIGNAFGYSDPLLSHGVDYAIEGAQRLAQCLQEENLEAAVARYHKAARRLLWLDVGLHRIAYEVLWREALYKRLLPDGALVSGVRLGEKVNQLSWLLAGL